MDAKFKTQLEIVGEHCMATGLPAGAAIVAETIQTIEALERHCAISPERAQDIVAVMQHALRKGGYL
jgi:hypothetical protein